MRLLTEGIPYLLDDSIELDQVTVVVGTNASGKSTLLRAIENCLLPTAPEEEYFEEPLPTLLALPMEVDDEVLTLAYGSVAGIYNDWDALIFDIENFFLDTDRPWNPEIRDSRSLDDQQWFEQLPRLMTTGVSLALFSEVADKNREADLKWLMNLCRSLESAFKVGFHRGRVGVLIGVRELTRHRDTFNLLLLEPDLEVDGTMLQSLARASTEQSMDSRSFVWLRDPEYHISFRDDVEKGHSSSPLLLAYERSSDRGLNAAIEDAVVNYVLTVIRELQPNDGDVPMDVISDLTNPISESETLVADAGVVTVSDLDAGVFIPEVPDTPPVFTSLESLRDLIGRSLQNVPRIKHGEESAAVFARTDLKGWWDRVHRQPMFDDGALLTPEVKPFLDYVVSRLERMANSLAPSFVKENGVIRVRVEATGSLRPVSVFFETAASQVPLDSCSDGVRKYITLALQLALHQMRQGTIFRCELLLESEVEQHSRAVRDLYERVRGVPFDAELRGDGDTARLGIFKEPHVRVPMRSVGDETAADVLEVTFVELPSRPVLLLDEPENHLHPMACRSVRSWIEELSSQFMLVVVATHNPVIMDVSPGSARLLIAEKVSDGARISDKHHNARHQEEVLIDQMGLTRSDLLLMSSYVLFVEGIHDKIVLETWFSSELRRAGVLIFPLHGLRNMRRLPDAELIWELGKRTGILLDDLDSEEALDPSKGVDKSSTAYVTRDLLARWQAAGRSPDVFGLSRKDILFYIDPEAVRQHSREFDTWEDAYRRAVRAGKSSSRQWKRYVSDEMGVDVSDGGEESIREMCRTALEMELRPAELKSKIEEVVRSATFGKPTRGSK